MLAKKYIFRKHTPFKTIPPPLPTQSHTTIVRVNSSRKSKGIAILLAIFLRGFGIHKFYLGQTLWGIVYLLFFWTFTPAIISLFKVVILLFMNETEFNQRFD